MTDTSPQEKRLREFCAFIKGWTPNESQSDELYAFAMAEAWLEYQANLDADPLVEVHSENPPFRKTVRKI
jgi:hypothetical protein